MHSKYVFRTTTLFALSVALSCLFAPGVGFDAWSKQTAFVDAWGKHYEAFHGFADGHDLTGLDLQRVAAVPAHRFDCRGDEALTQSEVACVGIDSLNIDNTETGDRPVHTTLLGANIPIVEHLTNLGEVPATGFTFTAVPPKIEGAGTFAVRAFATLP